MTERTWQTCILQELFRFLYVIGRPLQISEFREVTPEVSRGVMMTLSRPALRTTV